MFRIHYDCDVTTWSPQGRLHQIEYAMEAITLGGPTVGLKNRSHSVLASLKRATSEVATYQKKIIEIDNYVGISFSGLIADVKILSTFLRTECLSYAYTHNAPLPMNRLVDKLSKRMHLATQKYNSRPFGVGILAAGYDELGPHIYEVCPSGSYFTCKAMAIGGRCQSARTYLENHLEDIRNSDLHDLIKHSLRSLQSTLSNNDSLNNKNLSIGVVGSKYNFKTFFNDAVVTYIDSIKDEDHRPDRKNVEEEK